MKHIEMTYSVAERVLIFEAMVAMQAEAQREEPWGSRECAIELLHRCKALGMTFFMNDDWREV